MNQCAGRGPQSRASVPKDAAKQAQKTAAELRGPIIKAKPRGRALPHASETYINQKQEKPEIGYSKVAAT